MTACQRENTCTNPRAGYASAGIFYYVDAICFGIERLGSPAALPLLERLHSNPLFHAQHTSQGYQVDYFPERRAYLELLIARALARCGSPRGYRTLIAYPTDARALLARHAPSELNRLTGQSFGSDPAAWVAWLDAHGDVLAPLRLCVGSGGWRPLVPPRYRGTQNAPVANRALTR